MHPENVSAIPDFEIRPNAQISNEFLKRNIFSFKEASHFIHHLPYGRNTDKENLCTVFSDKCGTCSTKHAVLKQLIDENNFEGVQLFLGLYKMSGGTTPAIRNTLEKYGLEYIPEAHSYLKFKGRILDFTKPSMKPSDFVEHLIEEIEIRPDQITAYKVTYHKNCLETWLRANPHIKYTLQETWDIREQCIRDLSQ